MMESNISERFSKLIKALELTPTAFARSVGKSHTAINTILDGKSKPSYDLLESIFEKYPNVNPDWLMRGEGEMLRVANEKKQVDASSFGDYVFQILEELHVIREQVTVKDQQIAGMQRTIDALLGNRAVQQANFLEPAIETGRVIELNSKKEAKLATAV